MKLREWMNIVNDTEYHVLMEAQDYSAMFNFVKTLEFPEPTLTRELEAYIRHEINWAKQNLKKSDRIIWYLRLVKAATVIYAIDRVEELPALQGVQQGTEVLARLESMLESMQKEYVKKSDGMSSDLFVSFKQSPRYAHVYVLDDIKEDLLHALSFPYAPIQNYVFSWQSIRKLRRDLLELEQEYLSRKAQYVPINEEDKVVIPFNDGFAWVLLDRVSCTIEGDAMGHCGNTGSPKNGDRILSLRNKIVEKNKDGTSETVWRPSLTFILNKDGYLGEMKGRNNNKPDEKYHSYIITLLKSDMVNGIVGGGYKPENNFRLSDLTEEQRENLYQTKPTLAPMSYQYRKFGITEHLIKASTELLKVNGYDSFLEFDNRSKFIRLYEYKNWEELVKDNGDRTFQNYLDHEYFDAGYSYNDIDKSSRVEILDKLSSDDLKAIVNYTERTYLGAAAEWKEDNDTEDFSDIDTDDLYDILDQESDPICDLLAGAVIQGMNIGAESDYLDHVKSVLDDSEVTKSKEFPDISMHIMFDSESGSFAWDTICWLGISYREFFDNIEEIEEEAADANYYSNKILDPEEIEFNEPYNGFEGYDREAAIEDFKNRLYDEFGDELSGTQQKAA